MKKFSLLLTVFLISVFSAAAAQAEMVYFIEVRGVITSATHKFFDKSIRRADVDGAAAFVIKLDTPGGLLDSTREIVQVIMASPVPVAVYVAPSGARAGSAGTFITLAADYAVMADGTNIGAAHPVSGTGEDIDGDMRDKAVNDTVSFIQSIAETRNRNAEAAVLTVSESRSFTATEALREGLIDAIVHNDDALILMLEEELNVNLVRVDIAPTFTERLSFTLSNPNILMLLLMVGMLMIFLEFKMPGSFVFAGIGIVAIVLFLIGSNFLPINSLGLLLVVAGMVLIVAEIFISSYGLLAVGGVVAMIGGMRIVFDTDGAQGVAVSISLLIVIVLFVTASVFFIGRLIVKDMKRKPVTGMNNIVGKTGNVVEWKAGKGRILIRGELWSAVSDDEIRKGDDVVVEKADGMQLTVKKEAQAD